MPKQQYIYRIQPVRPQMLIESTAAEDEAVAAHFDYLQNLTTAGTVKLAGRTLNTDSSSFGIIIFEAESETAAQALVENDPAVAARVFRAELFPYRVALVNFSGDGL